MSTVKTRKRGAVMVVGGGIGGIQTSLDLADLGFKVYLVEKEPSIGGNMVKLDKTFPTNDCSMCMISPKLVACARHPNIEIITLAQIDTVRRDATGNYHVDVIQAPRSVDMEKCTACGECMEACPVRNIVKLPGEQPAPDPLPPDKQAVFDEIRREFSGKKGVLVALLEKITAHHRYIPPEYLPHVAGFLDLSLAHVLRVLTFYTNFSMTPPGRHTIEICSGTSCRILGGKSLLSFLQDHLGVTPGETTADGRFTLRTVNCLGFCAVSPAMRVDENVYPRLTPEKITTILKEYS